MSEEWAEFIFFWSNWVLLAALLLGAAATWGVVVSGNAKDRFAKSAKTESDGKIADAAKGASEAAIAAYSAGEVAGEARAGLASAQSEIAKQKAIAAQASLETEKLKSVVTWRSFSPSAITSLEAALRAHPGSVNLRYTDGDPEALYLAIQLSKILDKAGWKIAPGASKPAGALVFGFALPNATSDDGKALRAAFAASKIPFSSNALPPAGVEFNVSMIPGAPILLVGSRAPVMP